MERSDDDEDRPGDVLSSIRRLVAEEAAEQGRREGDEAAPLVLGDALRVRGGGAEGREAGSAWPSFEHSRRRKAGPGRGFRELGAASPPDAGENDAEAEAEAPLSLGRRLEPVPDPADGTPPPESGFFDEETLRAMVAEMVREELDTALGDDLTRRIRRLVRREVAAALERPEGPAEPDGE